MDGRAGKAVKVVGLTGHSSKKAETKNLLGTDIMCGAAI